MPTLGAVVRKVRAVLTDDLLNTKQREARAELADQGFPVTKTAGHCYVAAEAVWHLMGGRHSGLQPMVANLNGTHWWLRREDGHPIDPTGDQFAFRESLRKANYRYGRPAAFLTKRPSKRAAEVIRRVRALNRKAKS